MASFRETVNNTLLVMDSTWSEQNGAAYNHINSNSRFLCRHFLFIIYPSWKKVCVRNRGWEDMEGQFFPSFVYNMLSPFSLFLQLKFRKEKQWLNLTLQIESLNFPGKMSLKLPKCRKARKFATESKTCDGS